jgi:hypothetical protein
MKILIFVSILLLSVLSYVYAALDPNLVEYTLQTAPVTNTQGRASIYAFAPSLGTADQPVANQRLTATITLPTMFETTKAISFAGLGITCSSYSVTLRTGNQFARSPFSVSPIVVQNGPTEVIFTITNLNGDYAGFKCTYYSYYPLYMVLQIDVADAIVSPAQPDWLIGAVYHYSGMHISTRDALPPLSIEYVDNQPNTMKITLYQIQNGLFDLTRVVIAFARITLQLRNNYSNPKLIFTPEELAKYPSLSTATAQFRYVEYADDTGYQQAQLSIDGIPVEMTQISFTVDLDRTPSSLSTIGIHAYLREQQKVQRFDGGIASIIFRQYIMQDLSYLNKNGLYSIVPSTTFVNQNGFRFFFNYATKSTPKAILAWPASSLTSLIYILQCGTVAGSPTAPAFNNNDSGFSRGGWSLPIVTGSANPQIPAQLYCEVYVSGLINQLDRTTLLNEYLFEIVATDPSYAQRGHSTPPQSLSDRAGFLDNILDGLTPITSTLTHGCYFSSPYTFQTVDNEQISIIGTHHAVKVDFPGLFYYNRLSITLPPYIYITSKLFKKNGNAYFIDMSGFQTTKDSTNLNPTALPVKTPCPNLLLMKTTNPDGSITWSIETGNLVDKTLVSYSGIDVINFSFEFDIYRTMSKAYDGGSYSETDYYYVDKQSNKVPTDLGTSLHLQLEQYSALGIPGTPLPDQTRQFVIPTSSFAMTLPPRIVVDCVKNVATQDSSAYNTQFGLIIAGRSDGGLAYLIKDDFIRITIDPEWSSEFKFTTNSPLALSEPLVTMETIADNTVELRILNEVEFGDQKTIMISLLWLTPRPDVTLPSLTVQLVPKLSTDPTIDYTIAPYFLGLAKPLAEHSVTPQIKPRPVSLQTLSHEFQIPSDADTSSCYLSHNMNTQNEFVISASQKLDFKIVFGQDVTTANLPASFEFKIYSWTRNGSIIQSPRTTLLEYDHPLPVGYTLPADKTLILPVQLPTPTTLIDSVYVQIRYKFLQPETLGLYPNYSQTFISPLFYVVSPCLSPLSAKTFDETKQVSIWQSHCGDGGFCSIFGRCNCKDNFTGDFCEIPLDPCRFNQCVADNTVGCSGSDAKCVCDTNWSGDTCQISDSCAEPAKQRCSGLNGYLVPDTTNGGICSQSCRCNTHWGGTSCENCLLQCQNGGRAYKQCDKCGCQKGFTGDNCQCQSVIGSITLNAYNIPHVNYSALLVDSNGNKLSPVLNYSSLELLYDFNSIYNDLIKHFTMSMGLDPIPQVELNLGQTAYTLTLEDDFSPSFVLDILPSTPSSTPNTFFPTKMTISIIFNCDKSNSKLDLTAINEKWAKMVAEFGSAEVIKNNFIFLGEPQVDNDLKPIDDTLQPEEAEENNAVSFEFGFIFVVIFCLFSL